MVDSSSLEITPIPMDKNSVNIKNIDPEKDNKVLKKALAIAIIALAVYGAYKYAKKVKEKINNSKNGNKGQ